MREIDGDGAQNQAPCGRHLKEDQRLKRHPSYAAQLAVPSDAGDDAAEDERGHDHPDKAQKDLAQKVGLGGELGRVHAQLGAEDHGEEGPQQQRTATQREGDEKAETGPAQRGGHFSGAVKEPGQHARCKQQGGGKGENSERCAPEQAEYDRMNWVSSMGLEGSRSPLSYGRAGECT